MVVHDDREDARQRELGHQQRRRRRARRRRRGRGRRDGRWTSSLREKCTPYPFSRAVAASRRSSRAVGACGPLSLPLAALPRAGPHASSVGVRVRARGLRDRQPRSAISCRSGRFICGARRCRCARAARDLRRRAPLARRDRVVAAASRRSRAAIAASREPRARCCSPRCPTAGDARLRVDDRLMPANWIRALAGLPLGAAVAWLVRAVEPMRTVNREPEP